MWNGFEEKRFIFKEREAVIIYPKEKPNGKILLKTEYLDDFTMFDVSMLNRGYYLCHIYHQTRWAPDEETEIMAEFVKFCASKLDASQRCIVEGMSAGGFQATRLAQIHPELVAVLYLDAPVLNLLSIAGLGEAKFDAMDKFWREIVATYGVSRSTIINFRKSPIDAMDILIENNIPIIMLYGNGDNVVVYEENGKVLENYYRKNGGMLKVIVRSMCGHHPHGLSDPTPIIDFVEQVYR